MFYETAALKNFVKLTGWSDGATDLVKLQARKTKLHLRILQSFPEHLF